MAVLCIYRLAGRVARNPGDLLEIGRRAAEQPIGGNIFAGVTAVLKSPYLLGISVYIVLGTVLATFLYFHQAYIVSMAIADSGARTALFAKIDLAVNVLALVCQLFVVNRLIARFGVGTTLMVLPVLAVVGFFLIGLAPTLMVLVAFQVLRRAGEYAIARPAREILFTVLNREEKYKSKNFIDTVVFRGGDAVGGWMFEGLRVLGLGFSGIAFVGVPIALLWAGTGWMLGRTQEDMRKKLEWRRRSDAPESDQATAPQDFAGPGGIGRVDGGGQPDAR
jgi:ATP:ADP antiporter, AAA family